MSSQVGWERGAGARHSSGMGSAFPVDGTCGMFDHRAFVEILDRLQFRPYVWRTVKVETCGPQFIKRGPASGTPVFCQAKPLRTRLLIVPWVLLKCVLVMAAVLFLTVLSGIQFHSIVSLNGFVCDLKRIKTDFSLHFRIKAVSLSSLNGSSIHST